MGDKSDMLGAKSTIGKKTCEDEEFEEEDVWSIVNDHSSPKFKGSSSSFSPAGLFPKSVYSAPIDIPEASNMYKKSYKEDDDTEDNKVPPHEWIANKLAKSEISSFSVCEGVGRKLKGRDLSKVRNAVLSKTGFLE